MKSAGWTGRARAGGMAEILLLGGLSKQNMLLVLDAQELAGQEGHHCVTNSILLTVPTAKSFLSRNPSSPQATMLPVLEYGQSHCQTEIGMKSLLFGQHHRTTMARANNPPTPRKTLLQSGEAGETLVWGWIIETSYIIMMYLHKENDFLSFVMCG